MRRQFTAVAGIATIILASSAGAEEPVMLRSLEGGKWQTTDGTTALKCGTPYTADSDGFVSGVSGGNSPAQGIDIIVGGHRRFRNVDVYAAGTVPVIKGEVWKVSAERGENKGCSVSWMPVGGW